MDPEACLQRAEDAVASGDREEAREALRDYSDWRRKGGFEPDKGDARAHEMRIALGLQTRGKVST